MSAQEDLPYLWPLKGTSLTEFLEKNKEIPLVCDKNLVLISDWQVEDDTITFNCPKTCKHKPYRMNLPAWPYETYEVRTFTLPKETVYKLADQQDGKNAYTVTVALNNQELASYWVDKMRFQRAKEEAEYLNRP